MVRVVKQGRNATTKGTTRFEAVLYNLHSKLLRHFHL